MDETQTAELATTEAPTTAQAELVLLRECLADAERMNRLLGEELDRARYGADHEDLRSWIVETFIDHGDERLGRDVGSADDALFTVYEVATVLSADLEIVGTSTAGGTLLRFSSRAGARQELARLDDLRFCHRPRRSDS